MRSLIPFIMLRRMLVKHRWLIRYSVTFKQIHPKFQLAKKPFLKSLEIQMENHKSLPSIQVDSELNQIWFEGLYHRRSKNIQTVFTECRTKFFEKQMKHNPNEYTSPLSWLWVCDRCLSYRNAADEYSSPFRIWDAARILYDNVFITTCNCVAYVIMYTDTRVIAGQSACATSMPSQ